MRISEYNKSWKDLSELDKVLRSGYRKAFDEKFRDIDFINRLSAVLIAGRRKLVQLFNRGSNDQTLEMLSEVWILMAAFESDRKIAESISTKLILRLLNP